jgi:release factor glutamine methyltransferase
MSSRPSIKELLLSSAKRLQAAGVISARLDAEILLGYVLSYTRVQLITRDENEVSTAQYQTFEKLLTQRLQGVPLAYLTEKKEFYGRNFFVSPSVLIPRPETEHLVDAALKILANSDNPTVLDLGTGSGCIALTLLSELPSAIAFGADISFDALSVARDNARALGVSSRFSVLCTSWFSAVHGTFGCIVSNPPYVERGSEVSAECHFEPALALYAESHGLACLREIIVEAPRVLATEGHLLLEIGHGQAADCLALAEQLGYRSRECLLDLAGKERVVVLGR